MRNAQGFIKKKGIQWEGVRMSNDISLKIAKYNFLEKIIVKPPITDYLWIINFYYLTILTQSYT
jgi:hypothetical protein